MKGKKVAIIGAGFVGATAAYALLIDGVASEISLVDVRKEKAEGEALDLVHGSLFTPYAKITYGDSLDLCKDAEIVVVTAGASQKQGETRLDLVHRNAAIMKDILPKITEKNKECVILMVSNPLDVLTYLAIRYSNLPPHRIIGTGTTLDTARFRHHLGEYYGINPQSIHAYILGEHGDSEFPVWSAANIAGIPLKDMRKHDEKELHKIFERTKNAAYEIISGKGSTYYAIGLTISKLVRVILTDQHEVHPVSCLLEDYYGLNDVCLSIPALLHRGGIKEKIKIPLNETEIRHLKNSARVIRETIDKVL